MIKATILQALTSGALPVIVGLVLILFISRHLAKRLKRIKKPAGSLDLEKIEVPPLPRMDMPSPLSVDYAGERGGLGINTEVPSLPEIPLSAEQRQRAADWLNNNPL